MGGSPSTYLIRLPKVEDCEKVEKEIGRGNNT